MDMHDFFADWFQRFDRLDPIDAFLRDLHPDVVWGIGSALHGHARVIKW